MSRPSNQEIERYYFEQFRSHYPMPEGELEYTDKPDVIIRGSKVIGVEIANLYIDPGGDPASEQRQRDRRQRTLARAQELYLAAGGRYIELSVDFQPDQPILEVEPIARALADLAKGLDGLPSGQVSSTLFKHIPQLRFVYNNARQYTDAQWRSVQCYRLPSLSVERVRKVVKKKNTKVKEYQRCDMYWLLLVVDFMDRAQDQELRWPAEARLGESPFERIFLYKPQFAQVLETMK